MEKKIDSVYIKWIAIIAMVIDHCAWAFVPTETALACVMHTIGKITGPIMFFFLVEGYHHTRNLKKYLLRLFVFSIISYFPYSLFVNQGVKLGLNLSVISTLLVGLIALIVYDKVENKVLKWAILAMLVASTYIMDWSFFGVLIALAFGIYYGDNKKQWIAYAVVNIIRVIYLAIRYSGSIYWIIPAVISPFIIYMLLSSYNGKRSGGPITKWAFYVIYPVHFAIIGLFYLL